MENTSVENMMEFEGGQKAVITYDPDTKRFRGEFLELYGASDFYAKDLEGLKQEGEISLRAYKTYGPSICYG